MALLRRNHGHAMLIAHHRGISPTAIRSDRFSRHCEARSAAAIQGRQHGASGLPMPRRNDGTIA